jgi:amino acid adenylation domain-containing protein
LKDPFKKHIVDPLFSVISSFPAKNAFFINGVFYTYQQFGEHISKIRFALKELPGDDIHIGLVANDDLETYASIFALWLEGKAYIPLHPNQPLDRLEDIIRQMNIRSVLDSGKTPRLFKHSVISTQTLVYSKDLLTNNVEADRDRLAYVLFTSGSTGIPKGVTISRKNIGSFVDAFWESGVNLTEKDKCLQCFDLTFDASVQSYLAPLLRGACVYTVPHNQIKYGYVYGLLEDHQLTCAVVAPSLLRYLRPYFKEIRLPTLTNCILVGEASPLDLITEWSNCIPNARIFDFYGPTEATIYCTYYEFKRDRENKALFGMLCIGKEMKGTVTIVVDESQNILPQGEKGELCISGDQVSPGYWNDAEKNSQSFFEKEYNGKMQRFYRTGDLSYRDNDGDLMLYGRLDSQAKIQGYRVELGEIEFHAREFLKGKNAVVITFANHLNNTELAIFVEGEEAIVPALIDHIKNKVPAYMVPTKVIAQHQLPLNANGKVDKKKLKEKIVL